VSLKKLLQREFAQKEYHMLFNITSAYELVIMAIRVLSRLPRIMFRNGVNYIDIAPALALAAQQGTFTYNAIFDTRLKCSRVSHGRSYHD